MKVPDLIVYDVTAKLLDTDSFPQHTIAEVSPGITFIVLVIQEKLLRWKETHTQVHTRTHTHTHTHTRARAHTLTSETWV